LEFIRKAIGGNQLALDPPNNSTLYNWIKNNSALNLKKVTNLDVSRICASTKSNINPFFDLLENLQKEKEYRMELKVFFF
jgi:hypothetical protein